MAKSGGMLNAICAKLLKTTNDFPCDTGTAETCDKNDEEEAMDADAENNNEPGFKDSTVIKDQKRERMMIPSPTQDSRQSIDSLMSIETESSTRAKPLSPQENTSPVRNGHNNATSRRNRRKNVAPRNIAQLHEADDFIEEEIEEFEINNRGIDLVRLPEFEQRDRETTVRVDKNDDGSEMNALDLSSSVSTSNRDSESLTTSSSSVQIETLASEEYTMDVTGALDLSVSKLSKSSDNSYSSHSNDVSLHGSASSQMMTIDSDDSSSDSESADTSIQTTAIASSYIPPGRKKPSSSSDANDMKNYAQNTMNELLSLYGLGKQEAESITESVSLENFSSGNILARQTHSGAPSQSSQSAALAAVAGRVQKKNETSTRPETEFSRSNTSSPTPQSTGEAAYSKFVENISKMSKLPQGAIVPEQMKEILIAAAMMKHKLSSSKNLPVPIGGASSLPDAAAAVSSRTIPSVKPPEGAGGDILGSLHAPSASPFVTSSLLQMQGKVPGVNKFASSADYVKACFGASGKLGHTGTQGTNALLPDYSKYVKRFTTYEDCKDALCKDMAYKEHFHCMDCNFKVFTKKEEMIRHFKWHKKREESLQHGFLRFSPIDDCTSRFDGCAHNGKQTHYHCLQAGCNKVYISTSDVQMHSNYHRKDSAIIQEGFQRFRATEDCGETTCSFYGQRTTHFHCRRPTCQFTFKNKADMEKHKAYHQKDEALAKDGFKKFMKYEQCNFTGCRYSKTANHIHCIRPGCNYVLHSTGQLFSHKRKHEKRDFEHAYRRFKEDQKTKSPAKLQKPTMPGIPAQMLNISQSIPPPNTSVLNMSSFAQTKQENPEYIDMEDLQSIDQSNLHASDRSMSPQMKIDMSASVKQEDIADAGYSEDENSSDLAHNQAMPSTLAKLASKLSSCATSLDDSLNLPIPEYSSSTDQEELQDLSLSGIKEELIGNHGGIPTNVPGFVPKVSPPINNKKEKDETWKKYLTRYTANDPCHPRCNFLYKDHYHCNNGGCGMIFRSKDGVREHGRYHEQQDRITSLSYRTVEEDEVCEGCPQTHKHYHCLWASCKTVVLESDPPFTRLEHHKIHEYARAAANRQTRPFSMYKLQTDAFRRRRGRPPKYPKNDIPVVPKINMSDEDITGALSQMTSVSSCSTLLNGFIEFTEGRPCPDEKCYYFLKKHYHCVRPRCHHATDRADVLNLHAKDFHNYITILEGFEFFDRNVNCRRIHCHNNKANKHFHCMRPRCDYSFVRYSTMAQHDKKHRMTELSVDTNQDFDLSLPTSPEKSMKSGATAPTLLQQMANGSPLNLTSQAIKGTTMVSPLQSPVTITPPPAHSGNVQTPPMDFPVGADKESSVVKTKGTYFPMSGLSPAASAAVTAAMAVKAKMEGGTMRAAGNTSVLVNQAQTTSPTSPGSLISIAPKPISNHSAVVPMGPEGLPLQMLLQQKGPQAAPQLNWLTMKMKMHYGVLQNCGRPFCKLKKKDHYHCFDCNQAFSDPVRLRSHVTKHGLKVDKSEKVHQPMLNPALFTNAAMALPQFQIPFGDIEQMPRKLTNGSGIINITPEDVNNYGTTDGDDEEDEFDEDDGVNVSSSLTLNPNTFSNMLSRSANLSMNDDSQELNITAQRNAMDLSSANGHDGESASDHEEVEDPFDVQEKSLVINENEVVNEVNGDGGIEDHMVLDNCVTEDASPNEKRGKKGASGRRSSRKRSAPKHDDFIDSDAAYSKQRKIDLKSKPKAKSPPKSRTSPRAKVIEQSLESKRQAKAKVPDSTDMTDMPETAETIPSVEKDNNSQVAEPVLEGFKKFYFGGECGVLRCGFRLSGSHWHCAEPSCSFGLNDRSRAAAHTQKHAQVKAMLGDDFEHYTAKSNCNRPDCEHAMSAAHFHCKKCAYITTITNKVQVHRRQHEREEYISRSGFVQYTGLTDCRADWCTYNTKQTHYHCTVENCKHSTVGLSQMQAHKTKKHENRDK